MSKRYLSYFLLLLLCCCAAAGYAAPRVYPAGGTCDMEEVYHVNSTKDKTLRALNYTEAMASDSFPAFAAYWQARGWPKTELLDLYLFECAWNDWVWHTNFYLNGGIYIPPNFISSSRGTIIAPDGDYYVRWGCMTALGHYEGRHPNVYAEKSGTNIGCSPGTAIRIDHFGWSIRQKERNCIFASCWGMDYGVIGGQAYSEGVQITGFRLVGGRNGLTTDPAFVSNGVTMSHPGENSYLQYCMAEGFNNAGYCIIGGTPGMVDVCSAFFNCGPGFDMLGNNGLTNQTMVVASGDNNKGHLIRIRPMNAQSVGGGTFTLISPKSESRGVLQRLVSVEGPLGQLTLNINGGTADYSGVTCDQLIYIEQGEYEVNFEGVQISANINSLLYHAASGKRLIGGRASRGNTFGMNNEVGLYVKSRSNMEIVGGTTPPTDTWTCGSWSACTGGMQTRTCTCAGPCAGGTTRTESQACGTAPGGITAEATAETPGHEASMGVDASLGTYYQNGRGQRVGDTYTITFPSRSLKGLTFTSPEGWGFNWPATFRVDTYNNGTWTSGTTSYTGQQAGSVAVLPAAKTCTKARIVIATIRYDNGPWWSINNLTLQ